MEQFVILMTATLLYQQLTLVIVLKLSEVDWARAIHILRWNEFVHVVRICVFQNIKYASFLNAGTMDAFLFLFFFFCMCFCLACWLCIFMYWWKLACPPGCHVSINAIWARGDNYLWLLPGMNANFTFPSKDQRQMLVSVKGHPHQEQ